MSMNHLERFKAVCNGERPDYVPIFAGHGAPGMSGGCMEKTHQRLVDTGMPEWVGGRRAVGRSLGPRSETASWHRYWGVTQPTGCGVMPCGPAKGIKSETRIERGFEIIERETGAVTRQVIDNDVTYIMPEYVTYDVRDRKSWQFYRDRMTPGPRWPAERIDEACARFKDRDGPLAIGGGSTWGGLRGLVGPEMACTILYDDPALAHEIIEWRSWQIKTYVFPLIERIRPEIIFCGEDMCYNHGCFISPRQFEQFCAPHYRAIAEVGRECGAAMMGVDSDGDVMELTGLLEGCGINCILPCEVKAGNDVFVLREKHPHFILMGWLEKEVVNEGNGHLIENEIMSKVPRLLEKGRYFPNGDHGIQPWVTFENMCKFMTLLHEVCGNPEGEFPRVRP